jgi:hypothetical protein
MVTNSFENRSLMQPMRFLWMHSWWAQFFPFGGGVEGVFSPCSQCVLIMFPWDSPRRPQQHLNFISCDLPKVQLSCTEKGGACICFYFATGVRGGASIEKCPTFQKKWWWAQSKWRLHKNKIKWKVWLTHELIIWYTTFYLNILNKQRNNTKIERYLP